MAGDVSSAVGVEEVGDALRHLRLVAEASERRTANNR